MRSTNEVTRIVFENLELERRLALAEQVIYEHDCDSVAEPTIPEE